MAAMSQDSVTVSLIVDRDLFRHATVRPLFLLPVVVWSFWL